MNYSTVLGVSKTKNESQKIKEPEITDQVLLKLLKIIPFMVRKHWAHRTNYEDSVKFVDIDLNVSTQLLRNGIF